MKDFKKYLNNYDDGTWEEFAKDYLTYGAISVNCTPLFLQNDNIVLQTIESFGGEGMGSQWWSVFTVTKNDITTYYRIDGWYASYEGFDIDPMRFEEVVPVQVTKTEYKAV